MVKRTTSAPAVPEFQRGSTVQAVVPRVQINTDAGVNPRAGRAIGQAADLLGKVSQRVEDRLDIRAEVEALEEGALAGRDGLPDKRDEATIRGRAFNRSARDAAATEYDLNARMRLSELEQEYSADPVKFKAKSEAYLRGALPDLQNFDALMAQDFEASFRLRERAAFDRVTERQHAVLRDRQLESALRLNMSLREDLQADAMAVVAGDPGEVQETLARMTQNAAKLGEVGYQVGPKGRPLFSARERIGFEKSAEDAVAEAVGMAWMQSQPDILGGFQAWRRGQATIKVATGEGEADVNLRNILGERMYQKVQKSYMDQVRSEITLQNQIDGLQERRFNERSDALYSDLAVLAQDQSLPLTVVEAARSQLDPDKYLSLRALAKSGGASVSDGRVYSELSVQIAEGVDARDRLNLEYEEGRLTRDDYLQLYDRSVAAVDEGTRGPVETGRSFLVQNLGALSKDLGFAQSSVIGRANAEYEIAIDDFVSEQGRRPTHREARDIGEDISRRYSVLSAKDTILALPLPEGMSQADRLKFANDNVLKAEAGIRLIDEQRLKTMSLYLKKFDGNPELRDADPQYQREIRLLKQYYDILQLKASGDIDGGQ